MSINDHKYHKPDDSSIPAIQAIREATINYEALIERVCPQGRDLSLAKTNLEQARMWAIASIAKTSPVVEEPAVHPLTGMPIVPPHMPPEWHNPAYRNKA